MRFVCGSELICKINPSHMIVVIVNKYWDKECFSYTIFKYILCNYYIITSFWQLAMFPFNLITIIVNSVNYEKSKNNIIILLS